MHDGGGENSGEAKTSRHGGCKEVLPKIVLEIGSNNLCDPNLDVDVFVLSVVEFCDFLLSSVAIVKFICVCQVIRRKWTSGGHCFYIT